MTKGIDEEKTYADAIVRAVSERGLQRVSADEIGHIAAIAVEYAAAGYENGREDGIAFVKEMQRLSQKKSDPKEAYSKVKVDFGNEAYDLRLTKEDHDEMKFEIVKVIEGIGKRYN